MCSARDTEASTTCLVVSRRGGNEKPGLASTRKRPFPRLTSEPLITWDAVMPISQLEDWPLARPTAHISENRPINFAAHLCFYQYSVLRTAGNFLHSIE